MCSMSAKNIVNCSRPIQEEPKISHPIRDIGNKHITYIFHFKYDEVPMPLVKVSTWHHFTEFSDELIPYTFEFNTAYNLVMEHIGTGLFKIDIYCAYEKRHRHFAQYMPSKNRVVLPTRIPFIMRPPQGKDIIQCDPFTMISMHRHPKMSYDVILTKVRKNEFRVHIQMKLWSKFPMRGPVRPRAISRMACTPPSKDKRRTLLMRCTMCLLDTATHSRNRAATRRAVRRARSPPNAGAAST